MPRKITRAVANELSKQPPDGRFRSWLRHQAGEVEEKGSAKGGKEKKRIEGGGEQETKTGVNVVEEEGIQVNTKPKAVDNNVEPEVLPEEEITDDFQRARAVDEDGNGPYVAGSHTEPEKRHPSHRVLVKQAIEDLHGPQESDEEKFWKKISERGERRDVEINEQEERGSIQNMRGKYGRHSKRDKPNSGTILPKVPASSGYFYARKMHMDNLLHQPLPDTFAYRYLQQTSNQISDLDLVVKPYAVAWKGYGASGPTGCTKMKVHRPKTTNAKQDRDKENLDGRRPATSGHDRRNQKSLSQMDLAICWDFRPIDRRLEPKRPTRIDGSIGSTAPAVFTMVHTPKEEIELPPVSNHPNPIFTHNTAADDMGPHIVPYFEKDMSKLPRKGSCEVQNCSKHENRTNEARRKDKREPRTMNSGHSSRRSSGMQTVNSAEPKKCDGSQGCGTDSDIANDLRRHSRPEKLKPIKEAWCNNNKSVDAKVTQGTDLNNNNYYSHSDKGRNDSVENIHNARSIESYDKTSLAQGKLHQSSSDLSSIKTNSDQRHNSKNKYCNTCKDHKIPQSREKAKTEFKSAFKAGNPNGSDSHSGTTDSKGVRVPKMRDPYAKRTYTIPTLAPPFCLWREKSNSGYPEHWRLASVYQHAFKPPLQRRKPLLAEVYN